MNDIKGNLLLLCIILLAYSCKSSKEAAGSIALPQMTKEERLNHIIQSELSYNTLSSNLKFTLKQEKQGKNISVDAQLRIVKDEAIQLSLRVPLLGSEAFKLLITPENVLVIDRLNKQYLRESMQVIKSKAPFDFDYYSLEALLTNRLFIAGKKEIASPDYSGFKIREDGYLVNIIHTDKQNIQYDFTSDYSNRIQSAQMTAPGKGQSRLQCEYSAWESMAAGKKTFPMLIAFTLWIPDNTYTVDLAFKSVNPNTDFTIDYSVPNKYRQITLPQVIKLIENLL
jgi:hypothetical protein